ncbi:MAG: bacteriophage holin [Nitrospirae bacterium]|nr:bacteriophage holin [Nitrospirota bacterium]
MKLKPLALGTAVGIVWGGCIFLSTILYVCTGYGRLFLEALVESMYPGYKLNLIGAFVGLTYGFFDGLIAGVLVGWIYNKIVNYMAREK